MSTGARHAEELQRSTDRCLEADDMRAVSWSGLAITAEPVDPLEGDLLELIRSVAQATVEYVFDNYAQRDLWEKRHEISREVRDLFKAREAEDPDSELAAVRRRFR